MIALSVAGCSTLENPHDKASADFQEKYGLVLAHQQNVAYSLNMTAGKTLDQPTLESALETQWTMITGLAGLTDDATASGNAYLRYLQPASTEYANVTANMAQMSGFLDSSRAQYNSGAAMYNQFWGGIDKTMPYF